jgi:hypothetical protein
MRPLDEEGAAWKRDVPAVEAHGRGWPLALCWAALEVIERNIIPCKRVDGKMNVMLPEGVSTKDFEDWLNKKPGCKDLKFVEQGVKNGG